MLPTPTLMLGHLLVAKGGRTRFAVSTGAAAFSASLAAFSAAFASFLFAFVSSAGASCAIKLPVKTNSDAVMSRCLRFIFGYGFGRFLFILSGLK